MSMDLGTVAGLLGVALTVIFFVIGYRQTIGARKERAAATNRDIADTLLRRLTLESTFQITYHDIDRFAAGKTLENRVKRSDSLSVEELLVLLYSRVVSSDYIGTDQRQQLLDKINKCFKSESQDEGRLNRIELVSERATSDGAASQMATDVKGRDEKQFILLGLISSLLAGISTVLATGIFESTLDGRITSPRILIIGGALILVTSAALVLVYWLRERSAATRQIEPVRNFALKAQDFERRFVRAIRASGMVATVSNDSAVDLVLSCGDKKFAIELKLFPPNVRTTAAIIKRMSDALPRLGCEMGYLVVATAVPEVIKEAGTEKIIVVNDEEFFSKFGNQNGKPVARSP
ncbi:hypothetical protein [Rhodopseudomonas palustris]|uniref:Uncharacterized protein n=1 Tax=Rhodopseudomonas palustris TaxID=1076 RepID=A0A418VG35_RHOPL|nr:hypothetical protein [Rhodopseudomonas palustris]RJF75053.1 hypothetical protein D4Q52_10395 [Rhodopseudomonas palustris]